MNPGAIDDGLDPAALDTATRELASAFMAGSKATLRRMAEDETLSPQLVIAAVVKAHLLGAASMLAAAAKPPVDNLIVVTWLLEALCEALAEAASVEGTPA